jgi:tricorn protease
MKRTILPLALILVGAAPAAAIDTHDTRMLSQPAVSATHIAFCYADDLWVADLDGKNVRRLTSDIGIEALPVFSPDGKTLAFTGQYDGNYDVFTIPVEGGQPTRLTWHPGADLVRGWTPDGTGVLFASNRAASNFRHTQLFTMPVAGGFPTQLPLPHGVEASYSPDGNRIAYTPLSDASGQWKNYRGGRASRVWICRMNDLGIEMIPQPESRCNDMCPRWQGNTVFFRSDRNGEFNIFGYDAESKAVKQLTQFTDFPVMSIGVGGGNVVFEQAGYLHRFDPSSGKSTKLTIGVAADLGERRPRFVKGAKQVRNAAISPSGARAAFEIRGEIVTVPAEKGDPRNLTQTPDVHERSPAWSPDGKSVAYFSDASGEYALQVRSADGKGEPKVQKLTGTGFYEHPSWSPDGQFISYIDNSQSLYWIDLATGSCAKVASEHQYGPVKFLRSAWSPDSQWLAYTLGNKAGLHRIYIYSLKDKTSKPVTDGLSDAIDPVFDVGGQYLYFLASTDAGPINQWFSLTSSELLSKRSIYLAVLTRGVASPFARESDEEKTAAPKKDDDKAKAKDDSKSKAPVAIDFDGLDQRIVAFPLPSAGYSNLQVGAAGQLYYLKGETVSLADERLDAGGELHRYDLAKRKDEKVGPELATYVLSKDAKKVLMLSRPKGTGPDNPGTWAIGDIGGPPDSVKKLKLDEVEIRIEPPAEWAQMLHEAWRINRDYFYVSNMHGADWPSMLKKYQALLPDLATRGDLDRVISWMLSELAVGHSRVTPGERLHEPNRVAGGLLGADYEIANGRYRFKTVYGGLNWTPDLRAPLTAPGVDVKTGEYLLAVCGIDLKPPVNLYSLFENTAGKSVEITVGPNPDGTGSRTVTVEPLANDTSLRNRAWIEGNLQKVHKATGGRVAYVYVPNTAAQGHEYFKRYFFPQADKDAIIVDERFNGGGSVADYYIDNLRKPFTSYWTTRYGETLRTPSSAIFGPKVMLIDETAGSGGDLLPWMFRHYKMGPLVGRRTWGGLVGILGFPVLMDGGRVTAPDLGFWTPEEGYGVENVGVPPDIEVEQLPAEVAAGKDPQLDKALAWVIAELAKNPPKKDKQPPLPVRVKP